MANPSNRERLTGPQRVAYAHVRKFVKAHGYPPTVRELADLLGVNVSAAHRMLHRLRDAGWVDWDEGRPRTLRLLA